MSQNFQGLVQQGKLARHSGQIEEAIKFYSEAVTVCRQASEPLVLAHTIRHVGDLHQEAEQLDAAEACYREALAIYRTQANVPALDLANALRPYALLKERLGDAAAAKPMWTEARDLYTIVNVEAGAAECTARLAT